MLVQPFLSLASDPMLQRQKNQVVFAIDAMPYSYSKLCQQCVSTPDQPAAWPVYAGCPMQHGSSVYVHIILTNCVFRFPGRVMVLDDAN